MAVIGLVVAIILPAIGSAKSVARASSCLSNLRQLTIAQEGYFADNNERFFPESVTTLSGRFWWFGFEASGGPIAEGARILDRSQGKLFPYYGLSDSIEFCPAYPLDHPQYKQKYTTNWTTYGPSERLIEPALGFQLHQILEPSTTLAFVDTSQLNTFQPPASFAQPMFEQWHYVQQWSRTVNYLHDGNANAAKLDGSVTSIQPDSATDQRFVGVELGRPPADLKLVP